MPLPKLIPRVLDSVRAFGPAVDGLAIAEMGIDLAGGAVAAPVLGLAATTIAGLAGYEVYRAWRRGDQLDRIETWLEELAHRQGGLIRGLEEVLANEPEVRERLPEEARGQPLRIFYELLKADDGRREELLQEHGSALVALNQELEARFDQVKAALNATADDLAELQSWTRSVDKRLDELLAATAARPRLHIPLLPESEGSRFKAGARRTNLHGRATEFEDLQRFLDDSRPFCWWIITGEGGVGKTRLALDFCLERMTDWNVGFLERDVDANWDLDTWRKWQPSSPTLIVIDYVVARAERLGAIIAHLAERTNQTVRLLLLERDAGREGDADWYRRFRYGEHGSGSRQTAIDGSRFAEPRELKGLSSDEDLEKTIRDFLDRTDRTATDAQVQRLVDLLPHVDPKRRPLFAVLLAEAGLDSETDAAQWNAETLVREILEREHQRAFNALDGPTVRRLQNLFALATIVGGLDDDADLDPLINANILPDPDIWEDFGDVRFFDAAVTLDRVPAVEPDILGECLVLRRLGQIRKKAAATIMTQAWTMRPVRTAEFLTRAARDFGHA